jgi:hypothetical protein
VVLVSSSGKTLDVALDTPGLGLTVNNCGELKLIDAREGFHRIFSAITQIRGVAGSP